MKDQYFTNLQEPAGTVISLKSQNKQTDHRKTQKYNFDFDLPLIQRRGSVDSKRNSGTNTTMVSYNSN